MPRILKTDIRQLPLPPRTVAETISYWLAPILAALCFVEFFGEGKMKVLGYSLHATFIVFFGVRYLRSRRAYIRAVQDLEAHMCRAELPDDDEEDSHNFKSN